MRNVSRPAAIILATLLVALTPLFAYADAGGKSERSIADGEFLTAVNNLMDSDNYEEASHGGIVSFVAQLDFDSADFQKLVSEAGLEGKKLTRGQIISLLARSLDKSDGDVSEMDGAKDKSDKHATGADTNSNGVSDEHKGQGKDKVKSNQAGSDDTDSDEEEDDTADTDSETSDVPGNSGQAHGNGNQNR